MPVLKNISFLATCRDEGGQGDLHAIRDAALVWDDSQITWVGREADLPEGYMGTDELDAGGRLVIPGLVDCHTHLAFAGWRTEEFVQRALGKSYLEIAQSGGGIMRTVRLTRETDAQILLKHCRGVLDQMVELGVTAVECKSGYGLDFETELKILSVYRVLKGSHPVRIASTYLGAHVVPVEFRDDRSGYLDLVCREVIPAVAKADLAVFCDVFVEESAFSLGEARQVFEAGHEHGLRPKVHADQLSPGGGAELAAEVGAVSADHLEYVSDAGIEKMAAAGTVAVALPLASLYLNQTPLQVRRLINGGVRVAVATDFNPGSSPSFHLPLGMTLLCVGSQMTPAEALKAATIYAAKAMGMNGITGSIEEGKLADFAIIDAPEPDHWLYHFRPNACFGTFVGGRQVWGQEA
ncbi:MAG TPA: imidazolonepropionase [Acidobacteriota bacterium]|nr:imidazolonepropionase [Acidobacteriota bacterium]